jgi:hypothetical protein
MEQAADCPSASQGILAFFMESKCILPGSQEPTNAPVLSQSNQV